jgi:hypothetical protein
MSFLLKGTLIQMKKRKHDKFYKEYKECFHLVFISIDKYKNMM